MQEIKSECRGRRLVRSRPGWSAGWQYDQCNACRIPITAEDKTHKHYHEGVSCPHCFDKTSDTQKARFYEREKQMQLAKERGEAHIGADSAETIAAHRAKKQQHRENQRQASLQKQHR